MLLILPSLPSLYHYSGRYCNLYQQVLYEAFLDVDFVINNLLLLFDTLFSGF